MKHIITLFKKRPPKKAKIKQPHCIPRIVVVDNREAYFSRRMNYNCEMMFSHEKPTSQQITRM
jgi:hypothetical protein